MYYKIARAVLALTKNKVRTMENCAKSAFTNKFNEQVTKIQRIKRWLLHVEDAVPTAVLRYLMAKLRELISRSQNRLHRIHNDKKAILIQVTQNSLSPKFQFSSSCPCSPPRSVPFISLTRLVFTDFFYPLKDLAQLTVCFKWLRLSRYPCWLFEQQIKRAP